MPKVEIYMDHASTTYMDPEVLKTMLPYFSEKYGNPESTHSKGKEAKIAVDNARQTVSKLLNCKENEIIFCGSGTEANNIALFGIARFNSKKGNHIITSSIEHPSILEPLKKLEKEGFKITYLPVNHEGLISLSDLENSITESTTLVSIMYANNEIGTIQDIKKIGEICKKHNVIFHTDACQAQGVLSLNTQELNIDLMTLNGSKIYGPKGIGALYIKEGIKIEPIIFGGGQEKNLRSGTHNVANIVGFAKALELAQQNKEQENKRLTNLRDKFIENLLKIPQTRLNGSINSRLPNNVNITIKDIDAQNLLLHLDEEEIFLSTSSACNSKTTNPSHVLLAIGLKEKEAMSSIRLTLGKKTTEEEIIYVSKILPPLVEKLRKLNK